MLAIWTTILRAKASQAREGLADRNALLILDQQIRDAASSLATTRRALAIATARDEMQRKRLDGLRARIAELEDRAIAALEAGVEDLAAEAAAAIAELEIDSQAIDRDSAVRSRERPPQASRSFSQPAIGRSRARTTLRRSHRSRPPPARQHC